MVTEYFTDDHPAVLRLIELVVKESGDLPCLFVGSLPAGLMLCQLAENRDQVSQCARCIGSGREECHKASSD